MRRLDAYYFADANDLMFPRLARVLTYTAARQCADWTPAIARVPIARIEGGTGVRGHIANTQKLDLWCTRMQRSGTGDEILFLDVDTCVVRPLDPIWATPFDLAFATKRSGFPFNLGVLFVRVNDRTRTFFEAWRQENDRVFRDVAGSRAWRTRFGGVNQASFGLLRERGGLEALRVHELGCVEWNCEDSAWARFDPRITRVLHVKSALRRAIFHGEPCTPELVRAVDFWNALEREARAA